MVIETAHATFLIAAESCPPLPPSRRRACAWPNRRRSGIEKAGAGSAPLSFSERPPQSCAGATPNPGPSGIESEAEDGGLRTPLMEVGAVPFEVQELRCKRRRATHRGLINRSAWFASRALMSPFSKSSNATKRRRSSTTERSSRASPPPLLPQVESVTHVSGLSPMSRAAHFASNVFNHFSVKPTGAEVGRISDFRAGVWRWPSELSRRRRSLRPQLARAAFQKGLEGSGLYL
jgi:hypothetical protein